MSSQRREAGDPLLVWGDGVDDGEWWVQVVATSRHGGELSLYRGDEEEPWDGKPVDLPYGGQDGATLPLIVEWQEWAIAQIDSV